MAEKVLKVGMDREKKDISTSWTRRVISPELKW